MRNLTLYLGLIGAALLLFFVLLPVIGVILVIVIGVVLLALLTLALAPVLMKLPWFRRRIRVDQTGPFRTVRFGNAVFTAYDHRSGAEPRRPADDPDVIDIDPPYLPEGRQDGEKEKG